MSDRLRRDRIVGGVLVAVGALGLLGTLALGWGWQREVADGPRVGMPPRAEQDQDSNGSDTTPNWMERLHDRMQQGPLGDRAPGQQNPGRRGPGGMDGWLMPPGQGGQPWHVGPRFRGPEASPSPSPSPSPSASPETEASPTPSPTAVSG